MFNFIHSDTGLKVDFWVDRGEPFTRSCFAMVREVELSEGFWVVMASPEGALLHKVYWDRLMPSERELRDAQGILSVLGEKLDVPYVEKWAKDLRIEDRVQCLLGEKKLPNLET